MNKINIASFVSGLLFATGLGISGMMSPEKVHGFLDITGKWDPSLVMVMAGAVVITFLGYPLVFKRKAPVLEESFAIPSNKKIDNKLILGAVLFGAGWGIGGLCPGPAIANLGSLNPGVFLFVASMFTGFYLQQAFITRGEKLCDELVMEQCTVD